MSDLPPIADVFRNTLDDCRAALRGCGNCHPIHLARLDIIETVLLEVIRQPAHCQRLAEMLRRAEHAADVRNGGARR